MSLWKDLVYALNNKYDICLLGADNIGKSSFAYAFVHERISDDEFDVGEEYLYTKEVMLNSKLTEVTILDTSSSNDFLSQRTKHLKNANALMLAFAIDDLNSFYELEDMFHRIGRTKVPVYLVGLKADRHVDREVQLEDIQALSKSVNAVCYHEVSTINGLGIRDAFKPYLDLLQSRGECNEQPEAEVLPTAKKLKLSGSRGRYRTNNKDDGETKPIASQAKGQSNEQVQQSIEAPADDIQQPNVTVEIPDQPHSSQSVSKRRSTDNSQAVSANTTLVKIPTSLTSTPKDIEQPRFLNRNSSKELKQQSQTKAESGCCVIT